MRTAFLIFCLFLPNLTFSQIRINEILSSNVNGILDEDQEFSDWIEIYNNGDVPVDISGYGLTDDPALPLKWTFPILTLPAQKYLLVFASDKNRKELPMSFYTLIDAGEEWKYLVPTSDIGAEWHDTGFNDSSWSTGKSGFGFADNDDSTIVGSGITSIFIRKEFTVSDISDMGRIILCVDYDDGFVAYINGHEVARANLGNQGEYMAFDRFASQAHEASIYLGGEPEYFEILDPGTILNEGSNVIAIQVHNNIINSSDLSLIPFLSIGRFSDGPGDISPYLNFTDFGGLHANFKIDADSDYVFLFNDLGVLIDSVGIISMQKDVSLGRQSGGSNNWQFFGIPTPSAPNNSYAFGETISDSVIFSPGGGMYPAGIEILLSSPNPTDSIYYTIDGSIPDTSDLLYAGPVAITGSKVVRARVINYDELPGPVISKTYTTNYRHDIPMICLSTEPANLWDTNYGIYAFGPNTPTVMPFPEANYWKDWERPVFIEYYDADGIQKIGQEAGMKIFGAWSRCADQKSLSLFARKSYGKGSFRHNFFADKPIDKFESIILRNSGNDNMGLQFHDCFMTGLTRDMNTDRQAYQPAAVYLNGEYWGLLNLREKVSINYISENHYLNADSVNLLEGGGTVVDGTNVHYNALINYLNTKTTLQNDADYDQVRNKIDIDNYIQYQLTQIYLNNRDWPGNNIKFWNSTSPESKWRWILYDTDFGYGIWNVNDDTINTLAFALATNGPSWPNPPWATLLFRRLTSNQDFRKNFIIQFCDRLNLDFHPQRVNTDLDSIKNLYDNEIVNNFNRWKENSNELDNYNEWNWRIGNRRTFGQNRPGYCRQHLQKVFQLGSMLNVNLDVTGHGEGYIKLNTITPKVYPFTGIYFRNIPITLTAIPAPGYRFARWEGSVSSTDPRITYNMAVAGSFQAVFTEASDEDFSVIINEINYSSAPERNTKDWVEIYNNGNTTVDLSGWLLIDSDVDSGYYFPEGKLLIPGEYLVICRDIEDFRNLNPNVSGSIGDMLCGLSSEGDIVRLFDKDRNLIDAVNYGVLEPWPESANGSGATLELKNPGFNNMQADSWQAVAVGGTPGRENSDWSIPADVDNDLIVDVFDCYPNPFRDFVTISFNIKTSGKYRVEVADMHGRIVSVPVDQYLDPGTYWFDWFDNTGVSTGGVYTVRLSGDQVLKVKKIISLK